MGGLSYVFSSSIGKFGGGDREGWDGPSPLRSHLYLARLAPSGF